MSNQQYLSELVDFYTKHTRLNQKQEIVASPSYLPFYKNKPEEQILYEYLKEKRGSVDKLNESRSVSSSWNDRNISDIDHREQVNSSFHNRRRSNEYFEEPNSSLVQEIQQRPSDRETKRPDYEDYRDSRDSSRVNSQDIRRSPLEIAPSNPRLNNKEEEAEQLLPKEDPKPKKASNLLERLNAKKQEAKQPKLEEVRSGQDLNSNTKSKAEFSNQDDSTKANRNEEPEDLQEPSNKRPGFMNIVNKESQRQNTRPQEQPVKSDEEDISERDAYQPLPNKDLSFRESPLNRNLLERSEEEQQERSESKQRKTYEQEPQGIRSAASEIRESEPSYIATKEEPDYYRPKQEPPRIIKLSSERQQKQKEQSPSEQFRPQDMDRSNASVNERENSNIRPSYRLPVRNDEEESLLHNQTESNYRASNTVLKSEAPKKKFTLEKEPEDTEEYRPRTRVDNSRIVNKEDSMRQSQNSANSRQRDYDEPEYQPAARQKEDFKERSQIRSRNEDQAEFGRTNQNKGREYSNEEDIKMTESNFVNQREQRDQGYYDQRNTRERTTQPNYALDKPMRSETSIVESTEKKGGERIEKAGTRSVANYLKSIEEMLMKVLAKQEVLEENQRKILQVQNRQEEAIEDIRLQMTGEE